MTSSGDENIKLWHATTWELLTTLKLPASGGGFASLGAEYKGGKKMTSRQLERMWLTSLWVKDVGEDDAVSILSSSHMGEIIKWKFKWPPLV